MNVSIQSLHFDASDYLKEFTHKKLAKLSQYLDTGISVEVVMRVVKSDERSNKEVSIKYALPDSELFASKQTDTFEESVALCVDALLKQIERYKEKKVS